MTMNQLNKQQLDALTLEIREIVVDVTKEGGAYAEEFARYAAAYVSAAITDPQPDSLSRFTAQARVVAETIKEMGDQATETIVLRLEDVVKVLLAVAKAAI